MMDDKFVIYFDFPSTPEQIENVEKFSLNTSQSIGACQGSCRFIYAAKG